MTTGNQPPLCVDLDGTLINGDTLVLTLGAVLRSRPWLFAALPVALLLGGRPGLKRFLARRFIPDPRRLPWRASVVDFVRRERVGGRTVLLVTAADRLIADAVANHLGLFDGVVATDGRVNLKGRRKLAAIRKVLPDKEFDYIGDSVADLPVIAAARQTLLVAPSESLLKAASATGSVSQIFPA